MAISNLRPARREHPSNRRACACQDFDELSIRVLGPGTLAVKYGGQLMLTYLRGRFAFHLGKSARRSKFDAINELTFTIPKLGTGDRLMEDLRFRESQVRIARTMLNRRHGGTLLIVPPGAEWGKWVSSSAYAPTSPVTLVKQADAQTREYQARRIQQLPPGTCGEPNAVL